MYCRFCGKSVPADSAYCPKCGKPLSDINDTDSQPENKPKGMPAKSRIAIICLSAATVILICLVFALQWQKLQVQEESRMTIESLNSKIEYQKKLVEQRDNTIRLKDSKIRSLNLTQSNYDFIITQLRRGNIGSAAGYFKVDQGIVVVQKTDMAQKIKLTTAFSNGATIDIKYKHSDVFGLRGAASLEFDDDSWYNNTTLTVHPHNVGVTSATFTSSSNDLSFSVLIIVTD